MKQIKTQDSAVKLPEIVYITTQRVRVNPKVEVIHNTSETRKGMKAWNKKRLYELPKKIMTGNTTARRIHIDDLNHVQYEGE